MKKIPVISKHEIIHICEEIQQIKNDMKAEGKELCSDSTVFEIDMLRERLKEQYRIDEKLYASFQIYMNRAREFFGFDVEEFLKWQLVEEVIDVASLEGIHISFDEKTKNSETWEAWSICDKKFFMN